MQSKIGRRIYFDKITGNVIIDTGERTGFIKESAQEQDLYTYNELIERATDTFDMIQLEYGQYTQDFAECNGYRVNPTTLELEFSYPDPNLPPSEQIVVFQKPLSEQMSELTNTVDLILTEIIPSLMA